MVFILKKVKKSLGFSSLLNVLAFAYFSHDMNVIEIGVSAVFSLVFVPVNKDFVNYADHIVYCGKGRWLLVKGKCCAVKRVVAYKVDFFDRYIKFYFADSLLRAFIVYKSNLEDKSWASLKKIAAED